MNNLVKLITELNKTNSSTKKQEILSRYTDNNFISKILYYTYNPLIQFGISSKNVIKYSKSKKYDENKYKKYFNLFTLLDDLKDRVITGNLALKSYYEYVIKQPENTHSIFYNIIDKNLKIRMGEKSINKVYKYKLVPVFDPVLAVDYTKFKSKINKNWYISRKLDGVRCLMYIGKDEIVGFSRNGKDLYNLNEIIKNIPLTDETNNHFLDGELVYLPNKDFKNNKEDFIKTIEIVRKRKSKTKINTENLFYAVFDIIPESCFFDEKKCPKVNYIDRYKLLERIFKTNKKIIVLPQYEYSDSNFNKMIDEVEEKKWEGLMIRKNTIYKGGRTKDLLKVKQFQDTEFKVKNIIKGNIRVISNKTGLEETIETMVAIIIDYKNTKVGSGFSIDERKKYYNDPSLIIGKLVTIKYFEKTKDSLRFPIFISIRDYE